LNRLFRRLAPFVLLVLPAVGAASTVWKGDFETGDLSQWTRALRVAPDRMQVVTSPVREGRYAMKVTVKQGDDPINASGNRNELVNITLEQPGSEYYYKWSTLFPASFPRSPRWQLFTQWHHDGCCGSPPLEFFVINDEMQMRAGGVSGPVLWRAPLERGHWQDFVLHVKWSSNPKVGFVELYHNGELVVPKYNVATQFPGDRNYLQFGLYRDASISQDGVIFHDGFTMATRLEDVLPQSEPEPAPAPQPAPVSQPAPSPVVHNPNPEGTGTGLPVLPGDDTQSGELAQDGLPPGGCGASSTGGAPLFTLASLAMLALGGFARRRGGKTDRK